MTSPGSADIQTLTRLTQEAEAETGLVDMTTVRLAKLFQSQATRRAHVVPGAGGGAAGWIAVRVDGCTGVLTADQCVFAGRSTAARAQVADGSRRTGRPDGCGDRDDDRDRRTGAATLRGPAFR